MLLSAVNIRKSIGIRVLLGGLNLRLDRGERVGLVGDNGSGKTTLLRIITGEAEADSGQVQVARGATVGYLKQDPDFDPANTVIDEAEAAFTKLHELAHHLRELEHKMADHHPGDLESVMAEYEKVSHAFEKAGGYAWRHKLEAALTGVGLAKETWETNVEKLSGGQRSRLQLAKLLVNAPDILLLDEPTNHLDLKAIEWIEGELSRFTGAILIVSHDRFLLDRLATRIDLLSGTFLKSYPGNYAAFLKQKELEELSQARAFEKQQADITKQAEFVRRFKAGQRSKEAKGREKRLNRLLASNQIVQEVRKHGSMRLRFTADAGGSENVLRVEGLDKAYGSNKLWDGIQFALKRGDRLGIVGPNGCGKTTLLRCLVGEADADAGKIRWGHNLAVGYYDQRLEDFEPENTVMEEFYDVALERGIKELQLRSILGTMRFSGEAVHKKMSSLSGGERARVAITKLLLEKANVFVLDEPTNHLDVASREALEGALKDFDGTIIAVSHDRYFLSRVTDRLLVFAPPAVVDFNGTWQDWLDKRDRETGSAQSATRATQAKPGRTTGAPSKMQGKSSDVARNKYARPFGTLSTMQLETRITDTEINLAELQQAFADGTGMADPAEARRMTDELDRLSRQLEQLEEEYFSREA